MAKRVQFIRHPLAQANAFTGLEGEITVELDNDELRVHDATKAGGHRVARQDLANVIAATTGNDGKMTAAQVVELAAATLDLSNEIARALAAEAVLTAADAAEILARDAAILVETLARIADVDAEEVRALAAELVLQNQITPNTAKLAGIEAGATADQTGAEIKALYEVQLNAFTDALFTKLAGIETGATADQTNAEIKTAYEANANTNAFTDALLANLNNQSGTNTGDEPDATTTVKGIVELATLTEANAGIDTVRAVTPAGLATILANVANAVLKTGNQTIAGIKTFSSTIVGNISGNAGTASSLPTLATDIAALALGAVGTYAWLGETTTTTTAAGSTRAGSTLRYAGYYTTTSHTNDVMATMVGVGNGGTPSGTWRAMGRAYNPTTTYPATLWLRIS